MLNDITSPVCILSNLIASQHLGRQIKYGDVCVCAGGAAVLMLMWLYEMCRLTGNGNGQLGKGTLHQVWQSKVSASQFAGRRAEGQCWQTWPSSRLVRRGEPLVYPWAGDVLL